MPIPPQLCCPAHRVSLDVAEDGAALRCDFGCKFPIVRSIPRFTESSGYAASFGLQWNSYRTTQLDSHTKVPVTRNRLARCVGGSLEFFRDKSVLEVGCGAGRFSEILLDVGASVLAFDISAAVEASYANCGQQDNYFVCQADLLHAPVVKDSFDVVLCLGVIQHTPDPALTIQTLAGFVKPGGFLVIDHYAIQYHVPSRRLLRWLALRLPPSVALPMVRALCRLLIPFHRLLRPPYRWKGQYRLRNILLKMSPVLDYYEHFPQLGVSTVEKWMELDTHDGVTDRYKHMRTKEEIGEYLTGAGMVDIDVWYGGNGVEAIARKGTS